MGIFVINKAHTQMAENRKGVPVFRTAVANQVELKPYGLEGEIHSTRNTCNTILWQLPPPDTIDPLPSINGPGSLVTKLSLVLLTVRCADS